MKLYSIPRKIKTFIFDIDGTLYTSPEFVAEQVDVAHLPLHRRDAGRGLRDEPGLQSAGPRPKRHTVLRLGLFSRSASASQYGPGRRAV